MPDTIKCNDALNKAFDDGLLLTADIGTLKKYLLYATEMRETDIINPRVKEGLPKRKALIEYLIELKLKESQARHSTRQIYFLMAVGALTLGFQVWNAFHQSPPPDRQPAPTSQAPASK